MTFTESIRTCLARTPGRDRRDGRASRSEYWWFQLFVVCVVVLAKCLVVTLTYVLEAVPTGLSIVGYVLLLLCWMVALFLLIPANIYVAVRRLHDTDRSGSWWLLNVVPVVGPLVLLAFTLTEGTPGPNQYGPSPKLSTGGDLPPHRSVHPAFAAGAYDSSGPLGPRS